MMPRDKLDTEKLKAMDIPEKTIGDIQKSFEKSEHEALHPEQQNLMGLIGNAKNKLLEKVKEGGSIKTAKEAINEKNIYNILVIGSDMKIPGTMDRGRADAVMLVSLNKSTGDIKLCSFERAMGVPVEGQKDSKLNDSLNLGDAILIQNIISECFSVNIDGFVHLDYDSLVSRYR